MPTFVTPSATTRPFRPLREYNDCNLPKGADGGQFGRNDDPRCAGGAGDEDRWASARAHTAKVSVKSEGTTKSSSKGKGVAYTTKVQVDLDEDHNPSIDAFVFGGGRTAEDVASAMLKYADPDNFSVTVSSEGETVGGNEVYNEQQAREGYDRYFTGLRPHEENRRSEMVSLAMQGWMRNVASHLVPGGSLTSPELTLPELQPADPSRASGKTTKQLALETIGLSAQMTAARWANDTVKAAAVKAWQTTMQDIRDSGVTLNDMHAVLPVQEGEWRTEALKHAAKTLGDPTLAQSLDEYVTSRQVPFEQWVEAQYGATNEPLDHGKVVMQFEGSDGTNIVRAFKRNSEGHLIVKHEIFESSGAAGLAKDLLRGSFETYEAMGVRAVATVANISTGGYSWARFGFLPDGDSEAVNLGNTIRQHRMADVVRRMKSGLGAYWTDSIEKQITGAVEKLEEGEREALWEIADMRVTGTPAQIRPVARLFDSMSGPDSMYLRPEDGPRWNATLSKEAEDGVFNIGRVMLTGLGYNARFEMNPKYARVSAPKQRKRLMDYIGDWTK